MQTMARRSSGTKGYTGYRGRRRGRGVLAVVLVVILLLACGFLFAQRYMVYDADGSVRFEFPWIKKTPQDDTANGGDSGDDKKQDDLEITVQKPVIKVPTRSSWARTRSAAIGRQRSMALIRT